MDCIYSAVSIKLLFYPSTLSLITDNAVLHINKHQNARYRRLETPLCVITIIIN